MSYIDSNTDVCIPRPKESYSREGIREINLVNISINVQEEDSGIPAQDIERQFMSMKNPPRSLWRVVAICIWYIMSGGSDATPGALLPNIEDHYGLNYTLVSLIWLGNAIGFILVACNSHILDKWFSLRSWFLVGTACSTLMFAIVSSGTRFPVIVVGFIFGGCGVAMVVSKSNIFLSRFRSSKYLSVGQSFYGLGATIAPLIATSFVGASIKWNLFYLILLGLAIISLGSLFFAFKGADIDMIPFERDDSEELAIESDTTALLKAALKNKITWLIAFFVFFYQGSEVSMGGWIVTYLLDYRGGSHVVGYVASGFWGGVTLGRLLIARPLHKALGARRSITVCTVLSLIAAALTWAVPNVIAAGIFVSIVGLFVGPSYPIMVSLAVQLLPRKIQTISITIATAFGSAGGAFFPFIIGLISQSVGAFVVLPAFLILYSSMLVLWLTLPNIERVKKGEPMIHWWQRIW